MGWSVSRRSEPARKLELSAKRLRRLRGAVKGSEGAAHITIASEKLRLAALAVIKAKRALIREYPQRDLDGSQTRKLAENEQYWLTLSAQSIAQEYGNCDT